MWNNAAMVTRRHLARPSNLKTMQHPQNVSPSKPRSDEVWDAGSLGCGELVLELRGRLMAMPGHVLRVIALDPGAPEDIPAWCRLTGHALLHEEPATNSYWIEARPAKGVPTSAAATSASTGTDEIYGPGIFLLAEALPAPSELDHPDATATARSKLCGSTATVDIVVRDGVVHAYAQRIEACLLGRASASVVARTIVGATVAEVRQAAGDMRAMLSTGAPTPSGRWADLAALAPVKDLKARHSSTLLVFVAVERALDAVADS